jgi:hypothetical protein
MRNRRPKWPAADRKEAVLFYKKEPKNFIPLGSAAGTAHAEEFASFSSEKRAFL